MEAFFWIVYSVSALAAFYHSFMVFSLSDPWYVALLSAVAIDGVTFYATAALHRMGGKEKITGLIGIAWFASVSIFAQVIWRYHALNIPLPELLRVISLMLVPASTTGAVVALGLMYYFSKNPVSPQSSASHSQEIPSVRVPTLVVSEMPELESVVLPHNGNGHIEKRKPGRPPKSVFAKDVVDPKVSRS